MSLVFLKNWLRESVLGLVDFLYPIGCSGCNTIGQGYLCDECLRKVIFIEEPYCHHCGIPMESESKNYCPKCEFDYGFHDDGISIALYEEPISSLIHELKYRREAGIAGFLASFAVSRLRNMGKYDDLLCDMIHPIPLFPKRQSSRGFNQSALIAKKIASDMRVEYSDNLLIRVRDTKSQTGLTIDERTLNVKDAFEIKNETDIKDKSILLVDDVMTTGSTIQECARVLKDGGAREVRFLTIARQLLEGD